jgi:hypothetical protein
MPEKSTYRHAIKSMTSSTNAAPAAGKGFGAPTAGEGSGAVDITMSRSLTDGAAASLRPRASSPRPRFPSQPRLVAPMTIGAALSTVVCPSSTAAAVTGGGGAPDSSTAVATASPSLICADSGSAHGGWGWGSEGTTRALKPGASGARG